MRKDLNSNGVVFENDKKIESIDRCSEGIKLLYRREQTMFDYLIYAFSPYFIECLSQIMQNNETNIKTGLKNKPPRDVVNFTEEILEDLSFFKHLGLNLYYIFLSIEFTFIILIFFYIFYF